MPGWIFHEAVALRGFGASCIRCSVAALEAEDENTIMQRIHLLRIDSLLHVKCQKAVRKEKKPDVLSVHLSKTGVKFSARSTTAQQEGVGACCSGSQCRESRYQPKTWSTSVFCALCAVDIVRMVAAGICSSASCPATATANSP